MLAALGVNQRWLFTSVFFFGSFLAGLGGALQLPREAVSLLMDLNVIAEAFVVVVIGGMGSVPGAYLASVLIGELNALSVLKLQEVTLVLPFLVMAAVLIARPWGLLGKPERGGHETLLAERPLRLPSARTRTLLLTGLALLALLPFAADSFTLVLMTDLMIAALFAASLQFMMGLGGMTSFGHAAYFGLGAYGAALLATSAGLSMIPSLIAGPFLALAGAAVFGWFCVRLSGVYLAMLTLAAAQIVWSVVFQWRDVTGGDDGILGVWPADWVSSREGVYWMALTLAAGGIALLWRLAHAPFGYLLRAGRDSPLRAEAIGVNVTRQQWFAFIVAGGLAGLAGAVFAFSKGSVFPTELEIPRSVDALVMVLLGGLHSLFGPLLGAGVFVLLEDWISRLDYWRLILGVIILVIVMAAPDGIAGGLSRLWRALPFGRAEAAS